MTVILDLADPSTFDDPRLPEFWAWSRKEDPVHWQPPRDGRPGFWAVTRHRDVVTLVRDTDRFRSDRGNVLDVLLAGEDPAGGRMLPVTDGAGHAAMRRLLNRQFTLRALAGFQAKVEHQARCLVDAAREAGACDFVSAVADALPVRTIADLMAVPRADHAALLDIARLALVTAGQGSLDHEDIRTARGDIVRYFLGLAAERRGGDGEDPVTLLTRAHSVEDVALNCYSLLLGGNETTRLTIAGIGQALAEHPEQWQALRSGEVGLDTAAEEMLRWTTAAMHIGRTTAHDTVVCGRQVLAGDIVTLWLTSANRDPSVFNEPDRLDLARDPNPHVVFAGGPHYCLGAELGRIEVRAVLGALRDLVTRIEPAGRADRVRSTFVRGCASVPVRLS
ncbi:cytochrome P450 [Kutzneria sp. NPDC052558]|uniref:cytochrome P450 n=1 Tax=Kutzneria sp. NPDC052558 TaxID=3364121 RepID=UPI0037CC8B02